MGHNELLFFVHLGALLCATLYAVRLGPVALTLLIGVEALLANLFVLKEITLFGFGATATDVFAVSSLYGLNLLREFYGKEAARIAANLSIGILLFCALMSVVHLKYVPSPSDHMQGAFVSVLAMSPRIFLASLSVYAVVQQVDLRLFGAMRKEWPLMARVFGTLVISETLDTILFTFFGLYGLLLSIGSVVCVSLVVKWLAIACSAPFAMFARRFVRRVDVL